MEFQSFLVIIISLAILTSLKSIFLSQHASHRLNAAMSLSVAFILFLESANFYSYFTLRIWISFDYARSCRSVDNFIAWIKSFITGVTRSKFLRYFCVSFSPLQIPELIELNLFSVPFSPSNCLFSFSQVMTWNSMNVHPLASHRFCPSLITKDLLLHQGHYIIINNRALPPAINVIEQAIYQYSEQHFLLVFLAWLQKSRLILLTSLLFSMSLFRSSSLFIRSFMFLWTIFSTYYNSLLSFSSLSTYFGSWKSFIHFYNFSHFTFSSSRYMGQVTFDIDVLLDIEVLGELVAHFPQNQMHYPLGVLVVGNYGVGDPIRRHIDVAEGLGVGQVDGDALTLLGPAEQMLLYLTEVLAPKLTVSFRNGLWYQLLQGQINLTKPISNADVINCDFYSSHLNTCIEIILIFSYQLNIMFQVLEYSSTIANSLQLQTIKQQNQVMHYSFKSTPTWTMRGRHKSASALQPGPADYTVSKPTPRHPTISRVTAKRELFYADATLPGPGAYEARSYISEGPKRSMSARALDSAKRTPGPQDYQNDTLRVKSKAPVFSIANKSKSQHQLMFESNVFTPGPTAYNTKSGFDPTKSVVIGTAVRKDLTETEKTPGPSQYFSESFNVSKIPPQCAIGNEKRELKLGQFQKTPGPANYVSKGQFDENKEKRRGFSCRKKVTDLIAQELCKVPGPGQYSSVLLDKKSRGFAPVNEMRKTFLDDMQQMKKTNPGPGHHNPNDLRLSRRRSTSAFNFGRSTRRPLDENQKTPGPVYYDSAKKSALLQTAPRFSVPHNLSKGQFLGSMNPEQPGPGAYDPKIQLVKQASQIFAVSKERRPTFDQHRLTPGPGYYNLIKQEHKGWVFSKEKRVAFTDLKSEAKHGGHYEIPSKVVDPPKYMNVQSKVKFEGTPQKSTLSTQNSPIKSAAKNK